MSPIFMMALIFAVFYFLLIVPQRKRQQQLQATIAELKAGARIVTTGGIIATITAVREKTLLVRTAEKSMLEITRGAVAGLYEGAEGQQ
jgi:preprotein translocase subunit YajC